MLQLRHIKKSFEEHELFSDFSYNFEAGKVYALIGKSGSGKTTLLNMMARLEPYDSGEIIYKGKPLRSYREQTFFKNELSYLFQNLGLIENTTIADNLELGLVGKRISKEEKRKAYTAVMNRVGLSNIRLNRKIYTLSGGEAQRVSLGKVMLKKPSIIMADEPTASLDPVTAEEILKLLFQLRDKTRLIVIATHNPEIWNRCDEIIKL